LWAETWFISTQDRRAEIDRLLDAAVTALGPT